MGYDFIESDVDAKCIIVRVVILMPVLTSCSAMDFPCYGAR